MFLLYAVLFVLGFYLFGLGITAGSALIFVGGLLSVSLAVALLFHLPAASERRES